MKENNNYDLFISYLKSRLNNGDITKNEYALFKISKSYFSLFLIKLNDKDFLEKVKIWNRDIKINNILKNNI